MAATARGPAREAWRREQLSKAHSASPRPQRFRPVDAVKLAKHELEAQTGPILKAGRLRLASVLDESTRDAGPVLHEGFYKLAATVTRPEPSLRQKAKNLQKSFEMELQRLRGVVPGAHAAHVLSTRPPPVPALPALEGEHHTDTFITQEEPSVDAEPSPDLQLVAASDPDPPPARDVSADLPCNELQLCVNILQSYARETSSDSRERKALLESASATAGASIQKFSQVVQRQAEEAMEAQRCVAQLKERIKELEEDTDGLRRVVQQMLKDEAALRKQVEGSTVEVNEKQQQLIEAEHRSDHLSVQLHKAMEKLHLQEDLQREAREKLRDGCNSPMMHFTTFVLGPDQVPPSSVNISSGEVTREGKVERYRTDKSHVGPSPSGRNSVFSAGGHMPPGFARSNESNSQVCSRSVTPDMLPDSSSEEERLPVMKKVSSRRQMTQESSDSEGSAEPPRPSPLAVSFPALVPYLDFQKDVESNKLKAQTAAQNHDHLEKHMMMLQEERQKHIEQNKLLQHAVDSTLERILVWVQAAFDSLTDFGPESVQKDAKALAAIRDMLAWLAERTCKAWIDPAANLAQVLHSHEERVRHALDSAEAASSSRRSHEVEELRRALQEQTERVEELQKQLKEAKVMQGESSSSGRGTLQGGTSAQGAGAASREHEQVDELGDALDRVFSSPGAPDLESAMAVAAALEQRPPEDSPKGGGEVPKESIAEDQVPRLEASEGQAFDTPGSPVAPSGALEAEREAQRMRIFRCPFAEGVDLTYVKRDRQFPYSNMEDPEDNKRLGRRQLRHWISEVYAAKRLEDRRRDKVTQPRRLMHFIMQEMLRRQHGVKSLVHQRSWQLLEAVAEHASSDVAVGLFADFLDGARDLDELSFYLYCSQLIASIPEEPQGLPPSRLPLGYVSESRCLRLVDLLFADLPKARSVVQEEIEKQVSGGAWTSSRRELVSLEDFSLDESCLDTPCLEVDALCRALLEGWRVCCLLLSKSMPHFSWRDTVMAFIQADVHGRGWLDPHEAQRADLQLSARRSRENPPLTDQTSLGAFVFRTAQQLGGLTEASLREDAVAETALAVDYSGVAQEDQICFQLCLTAFRSLERSLGVYLKWLLHSEEPRDRAVYRSVTGRIFAVRRAISLRKAWPLMHNLRCLLVLLLNHQFDLQLTREEAQPEHVGWELTALLHVLRESWRRGASNAVHSGPEFGPELEEVGETDDHLTSLDEGSHPEPPSRERPAMGHSVSFTVGKKSACD